MRGAGVSQDAINVASRKRVAKGTKVPPPLDTLVVIPLCRRPSTQHPLDFLHRIGRSPALHLPSDTVQCRQRSSLIAGSVTDHDRCR